MSLSVLRSKTAAVFFRFAETSLAFAPQYWSFALESIAGRGAPWVPHKSVHFRESAFVNPRRGRARRPPRGWRGSPRALLQQQRAVVVQALRPPQEYPGVGGPDLDVAPEPGDGGLYPFDELPLHPPLPLGEIPIERVEDLVPQEVDVYLDPEGFEDGCRGQRGGELARAPREAVHEDAKDDLGVPVGPRGRGEGEGGRRDDAAVYRDEVGPVEPADDPGVPPYPLGGAGGRERAEEAEPSRTSLAAREQADGEVEHARAPSLDDESVGEAPDRGALSHPPAYRVRQDGQTSASPEVICFRRKRRFISRERRHRTPGTNLDTKELAARLAKGDRRAVAKAITLVENDGAGSSGLLRAIGPRLGHAFVIGVTGPPGTGKSSLVDRLTESYRKKGLKVGIVAIDPTSPITGGALLGDRVRMVNHTMDEGVYIRSMASRGWAGGLSGAVADVIQLLDAAGMDVVMVETVGIGQSDTDVVRVAHAVMVVLMPGLGDDVQASKAGLMEIGDVYVVNKADLPGADDMVVDLLVMARDFKGRNPSVLKVSAAKREGIETVVGALERIRARFLSSPVRGGRRDQTEEHQGDDNGAREEEGAGGL